MPQTDEDRHKTILPLVSSVAIAHTIVAHKVHLDPDDYARLFFSLILHADPNEQTCTEFERLLKSVPSDHWQ